MELGLTILLQSHLKIKHSSVARKGTQLLLGFTRYLAECRTFGSSQYVIDDVPYTITWMPEDDPKNGFHFRKNESEGKYDYRRVGNCDFDLCTYYQI